MNVTLTQFDARDALTDAVLYWERRRVVYNAVLASIVAVYAVANWPASAIAMTSALAQQLFLLGVLANVAYCAAYVPEVLIQFTHLRSTWRRVRWVLFVIGLLFAAIIARFITMGLLGIPM